MTARELYTVSASVKIVFLTIIFTIALTDQPEGAPARASYRIGVLYWSMNIPGQLAMRKGLERHAMQLNQERQEAGLPGLLLISSVAGDGEEGIERQIRQMRELILLRVDLILVQPADSAALSLPLQEANAAGIPVVAYDQYISAGRLTSFITTDNYRADYLDGEYVAAKFPSSKNLRIVLIEYPHVSSTVERVDGFLDGLSENGQPYTIAGSYKAVEPVQGRIAGKKLLQDFPEKGSVDVVFTVNDGGGVAVVDELAKAGRSEILVATIDGDPTSLRNIRNKRLVVIDSAQFCGPMGATAISVALDVLTGKEVPFQILLPPFPVTRETLGLYPGWTGPIPGSFKKPWKSGKPVWSGELRKLRKVG